MLPLIREILRPTFEKLVFQKPGSKGSQVRLSRAGRYGNTPENRQPNGRAFGHEPGRVRYSLISPGSLETFAPLAQRSGPNFNAAVTKKDPFGRCFEYRLENKMIRKHMNPVRGIKGAKPRSKRTINI